MKMCKKFLTSVLTAAVLLSLCLVNVSAAPGEEYTYTTTFYAGNQGAFLDAAGLGVDNSATGSAYSITPDSDKSRIVVSGLKPGDIVTFDVQAGAVSLGNTSKYYVKGVRLSGRDNDTVSAPTFRVEGDADYVIAYGIKSNVVAYTATFVDDTTGNELAPSRTYYGNVGDKPVVASLYIENYTPMALAAEKTLTANEAENVFPFRYRPVTTEVITNVTEVPGPTTTNTTTITDTTGTGTTGTGTAGTETGTAGTGTGTAGTGTGTAGTGTGTVGTGTGTAGTGTAGTGTGTGTVGTGTAGTDNAAGTGTAGTDNAAGTTGNAEAGTEGEVIEPEEVPEGNQDVVDLDEDETPLAEDAGLDKEDVKKGFPVAAGAAIAVGAVAALSVLAVFLIKRRRG